MDQAFDEASVMPDAAALETVHRAIEDYNRERPARERAMQNRVTIVMGSFVIVAGFVLLLLFNSGMKDGFGVACGVTFFGGWMLYQHCLKPAREFQQSLRDRMLPVIFGFVERVQYSKGTTPRFMERFPKEALLKYANAIHDDAVSGIYENIRFMLSETELTTGGKNKTVLFKGVIFHFLRDSSFPGILAATKRPGSFQKFVENFFSTGPLNVIESGDPRADASHEFRTNNTTAAKPLVEGEMVSALDYLSGVWPTDVVRIALSGHECFLLVPSKKNFFELPDIAHDIGFDAHVKPMIRDLVTLLVTARLVSRIGMKEEPAAGS